jgi:LacI family transcriptional regulator
MLAKQSSGNYGEFHIFSVVLPQKERRDWQRPGRRESTLRQLNRRLGSRRSDDSGMSTKRNLRSRTVVALLVETSNAFSREVLHGIRDWMRAHGSWAIHLSEQGRGSTPPPWLRNWHGDGIIARVETRKIAHAVRACGVPVVNVSASGLAPEFATVISDSEAIARAAAEHLMERGLRQFGYCGDARFAWSTTHGRNFAAAVQARGFPCHLYPAAAADSADWGREQRKLASWLKTLPKPCGVMACYDIRGQQVLDACRVTGLRVPEVVAVIGQHNDELLCELCEPPLSSVIPNARRAGFEAAALLDRLMRGRTVATKRIEVPPVGIATRQSTDLVAVGDERLATAMRFIRKHAHEVIGVDDIARVAGISRSLLERKFREAFGRSPWDQVMQLRLRHAEQLLSQTRLSIAEIAERTGFGAPEYFSAIFRKLTGTSPKAARSPGR